MPALCHSHRVYLDDEGRECLSPVSFRFDDVLDLRGSKGCSVVWENKEPKTYVRLSGERGMWLVAPISKIRQQWEAYESGEPCWDFNFSQQ